MRGIYARTDQNGKVYVGLSTDIERRWREESGEAFSPKKSRSKEFCWALRQYGAKNFKNAVLEEILCDSSSDICRNARILNERKEYWIEKLDAYGGYNLKESASGISRNAEEKEIYYREHDAEIVQAVKDGIPYCIFISRFHLDDAYYECLKEMYPVKSNEMEYKAKNKLLSRGERIWYDKKKDRMKKSTEIKDWQKGTILWVDFSQTEFILPYKTNERNCKTKYRGTTKRNGLLIENRIYYGDNGRFHYVNSKSIHVSKTYRFDEAPSWATDFLKEKGETWLESKSS